MDYLKNRSRNQDIDSEIQVRTMVRGNISGTMTETALREQLIYGIGVVK